MYQDLNLSYKISLDKIDFKIQYKFMMKIKTIENL